MRTVLFTLLGVALLALAGFDVYATILRARKRPGPVSEKINRGLWWAASSVAHRVGRQRRHVVLSAVGPLLLPILVAVLLVMLVAGFALICYPRLPGAFNVNTNAGTSAWREAVYYSGVTLLTIGYGDVTPRTDLMRGVALLEGASGIAVISLAITYLLTVYGAVEHKRAVALSFYHQARQGADVAGFIAHYFRRGKFYGFEEVVRTGARDIQMLLESHLEHPVIHYFHSPSVYRSLPRVLFILLETSAVIGACLDPDEYVETCDHPEVVTLEESALQVVNELIVQLRLEKQAAEQIETSAEERKRRERCFRRAMRGLQAAGVRTRKDRAAGLEEYVARRERWERQLFRLSYFLGYDWDELTGDLDLADAVEDETEERFAPATQG